MLCSADPRFGRRPHYRVVRYLVAFVVVALATAMRAAVDPLVHDQIPYFLYVAAVVVATRLTGGEGGVTDCCGGVRR